MKKRISTGVIILIFLIGLSLLLYPVVSNFWNSIHQTYAIVDYESSLADLSSADYTAYFQAAEEYNQNLAKLDEPLKNYDQLEGYEAALDVRKNGMMGYITIPKIEVELPVYHNTSESVLSKASGHLEGSSLPTGGEGTHCVLSAHRGLPSAKLFTNLDKLETGDTFSLKILDRTLTYEVFEINVVKPDEVDKLSIKPGEDLCTLVTCTPYGINSHRLLVQGRRIDMKENTAETEITQEAELLIPGQEWVLGICIAVMAVLLCVMWKQRKRRKTCKDR